MRIFSVELLISGSITINQLIEFNTDKELDYGSIFKSNIVIRKHPKGVSISSTVYTSSEDRAYKVALLFIGRMLDVLSLKTNIVLNISSNDTHSALDKPIVRAIIEKEEFKSSFEISRTLNLNNYLLLRAYSWYRKGLYSEDPLDKFLAFWNSICVTADQYNRPNARTQMGIINKIYDCFEQLWGESDHWTIIDGNNRWINENNEIRNQIAHGGATVDINYVENVITKLEKVKEVAFCCISEFTIRENL